MSSARRLPRAAATATFLVAALLAALLVLGDRPPAAQAADCPAPTTLSISASPERPASIYDTITLSMAGTMSGTCATVTIPESLGVRTSGVYEMPGGVGTMTVRGNTATFEISPGYASGHNAPYTFRGELAAGVTQSEQNEYRPYTISFELPGMAEPVVINVPGCPSCTEPPRGAYKWSSLDDANATVWSGIVLGADRTRDATSATISDTLGAGQQCVDAWLQDVTDPRTPQTLQRVPCSDLHVSFTPRPGRAYSLVVQARVTDRTLPRYEDTGRVTVGGVQILRQTVDASWHDGSASGSGTTPQDTTPQDTTPQETTTTATTTTSTTPTTATTTTSTTPTTSTTTTTAATTPATPPLAGTPTPISMIEVAGSSESSASVSIRKRASRRALRAGQLVTYRLTVRARRGADARMLTVCDRLPAGLTYVRAPGARMRAGSACWKISRLRAGTARSFRIVARAQAIRRTRTIKNTAIVSGHEIGRRSASASVQVRGSRRAIQAQGGGVTG